ncbi:MAG: PAS domain S-box protein [Planctomycetes bacterium]|nr:PAS domain S-box protein [Planctomycetota bacterium]
MKLTAKLIITFVLAALIPTTVLSCLNYFSAKKTLKNQTLEYVALISEAKEGQLYGFIETVKNRAVDFSADDVIRRSLREMKALDAGDPTYTRLQKSLIDHLRHKMPLDTSIRSLCIADMSGRKIASTDDATIGMELTTNDYFIQGMKGVYLSDVYVAHDISKQDTLCQISVTAPITDKGTETALGAIINCYDTTELNKVVSGRFQIERGASSAKPVKSELLDVYLVNKKMEMISPSIFCGGVIGQKVETLPVIECAAGRETTAVYNNYLGDVVIGSAMCIPSTGWTLCVEMNAKDAFLPVTSLRDRTILLSIPMVILAIFFAYLVSRRSQSVVRESEERFKAFMDNNPALAFMKDEDGRYVYINATFMQKYESMMGKILGKTDFDCWPECAEQLRKNDKAVLTTEKAVEFYETVPTTEGVLREWLVFKFPVKSHSGKRYLGGVAVDISDKKKAAEEVQKSQFRLSEVQRIAHIGDWEWDIGNNKTIESEEFFRICGLIPQEYKNTFRSFLQCVHPGDRKYVRQSVCNALCNKKPYDIEFRVLRKDGTARFVNEKAEVIFDKSGKAVRMVGMIQDITERKRMETQLRKLSQAIEQSPSSIIITDIEGNIEYVNPKFSALTGYALEEVVGRNPRFLKSGGTPPEEYLHMWNTIASGEVWRGEFHNKKKNGELYWESVTIFPVKNPEGICTNFMAIKEDITGHKQIERRKSAQYAVTQVLAESATLDEASPKILKAICECLGWDIGEFWLTDQQRCVLRCTEIYHLPSVKTPEFHAVSREITFPHSVGLPGRVWTSRKPLWIADIIHDADFLRASVAEKEGLHGACCFPIMSKGEFLGAIDFISTEIKQPDDDLLNMMAAIGRQIGLFIKHKQAKEQTKLQLERLTALHEIDQAIASSFDLKVSLPIFLEKVVTQLKVDSADVLLFNPHMQTLEYAAGRGFRTDAIQYSRLRIGEGTAGQAALERRLISIPNLNEIGAAFVRAKLLSDEEFVAHYAIPLIAKGCINGVLEVFHRSTITPEQNWLKFLEALASQCAIAINDIILYEDLQRANSDLVIAYDTTLEGWAMALDLRDKETVGHSRRVTEMTAQIAMSMGISKQEIVHIRRGALLHDIGKMGIPDSILLKVKPLTDEEWVIMRKHPSYANELLSNIPYLRQALDVPYCHHEKWDGTGYPRGLKGEQIPLSARIFAVVDVCDALRTDRPYRKSWPEEKVYEHIRSLAGTHFDPGVVEVFLKIKLKK